MFYVFIKLLNNRKVFIFISYLLFLCFFIFGRLGFENRGERLDRGRDELGG